jgi:hypothetical protein
MLCSRASLRLARPRVFNLGQRKPRSSVDIKSNACAHLLADQTMSRPHIVQTHTFVTECTS